MMNLSGSDTGISEPAAGLVGLGHTNTKCGKSQYGLAMAANDILIIEQSAVNGSETANIPSFMKSGGTVIQAGGRGFGFPNAWFGTSIGQASMAGIGFASEFSSKTAAASSGAYAPYSSDDPATLAHLSSTNPANVVPTGATVRYSTATQAQVFHVAVGSGNYFYIGWDFCCGGSEQQRNNYYTVLDSAIGFAEGSATAPVPLPASLPLLGLGARVLMAMRRRKRQAA